MKKIQNGYDWNEFVYACRENVEKRGVFGVSQDGEKVEAFFIVKKDRCDYLGFFNSKTGKKTNEKLGDDSRGYLEQLAGPVGKFSFPFYVCDTEGKDREYIQRPQYF